MTPIDDGIYDAIVIDVARNVEDLVHVTLTITRGDQKGMVVELNARDMPRDEVSLLGLPVTLVVTDGEPRMTLD
ncbi:MAG TPA: hypothetical protein VM030_03580 [Acidimicrobiales bacterium]|nr:hypothetical protein [Acidimicrobiales bacterium]